MRRYEQGQKIRHHSGQIFIVRSVKPDEYDIECIEGSEQDRGVFEIHADYGHRNFRRMTGINVTTVDEETGDTETKELTDFVLVCGTHRLTNTQAYANGTVVLTLKPEDVLGVES